MRTLLLFTGIFLLPALTFSQRFGFSGEDIRSSAPRLHLMAGNNFSIDSTGSMLLRGRGGSWGTRTHLIQMSVGGIPQTRLRVQTSLTPAAFAQISVSNTNQLRPEITLTASDSSFNGTSMILKGDTLYMSIDGSNPNANIRYIMENMQTVYTLDTTSFKPLVINASGDVYKMFAWPVDPSGFSPTLQQIKWVRAPTGTHPRTHTLPAASPRIASGRNE
jgi:hypothetical protein